MKLQLPKPAGDGPDAALEEGHPGKMPQIIVCAFQIAFLQKKVLRLGGAGTAQMQGTDAGDAVAALSAVLQFLAKDVLLVIQECPFLKTACFLQQRLVDEHSCAARHTDREEAFLHPIGMLKQNLFPLVRF